MALTQGLQLPYGIQPVNPVPVDSWSGPYTASTAQGAIDAANAAITSGIRFQSMEVRLIIAGVSHKYWYRDGIADADLVEFSSGSGAGSNLLTELVLNETPTGVMDGINKQFSLAHTPAISSSVMLWLNGQLLTQGASRDYTVSGSQVQIGETRLVAGDVILAMYSKVAVVKRFSLNETATFITIAGSLRLQIENTPDLAQSLMLFRNGQLLTQNVDYTISGRQIQLISDAIENDDIFLATYSY